MLQTSQSSFKNRQDISSNDNFVIMLCFKNLLQFCCHMCVYSLKGYPCKYYCLIGTQNMTRISIFINFSLLKFIAQKICLLNNHKKIHSKSTNGLPTSDSHIQSKTAVSGRGKKEATQKLVTFYSSGSLPTSIKLTPT